MSKVKSGTWLQNGDFITAIGPYQRVTLQGVNSAGKIVRLYQNGYDAPNGDLIPDQNLPIEQVKARIQQHYENAILSSLEPEEVKQDISTISDSIGEVIADPKSVDGQPS
jgi:hypothetical protein